jgi:hypothetical protein
VPEQVCRFNSTHYTRQLRRRDSTGQAQPFDETDDGVFCVVFENRNAAVVSAKNCRVVASGIVGDSSSILAP